MHVDCCKAPPVSKVCFWQFSQARTFAHAEKEISFCYTAPIRVPYLNRDDISQSKLEAIWWQIRRSDHTETKHYPSHLLASSFPTELLTVRKQTKSLITLMKLLKDCALLKSLHWIRALRHNIAMLRQRQPVSPKPRKTEGCKIHLVHPGRLRQECSEVCCWSGGITVHELLQPGQHMCLGVHIQSRVAWEHLPSITTCLRSWRTPSYTSRHHVGIASAKGSHPDCW